MPTSDGQHEHFALVTEVISREMKNLAAQGKKAVGEAANEAKTPESRMAGAVGLALCRINKIKEQFDSSRIAIISSSTESQASFPNQYMNFMNDFFTAQKMVRRVGFDALFYNLFNLTGRRNRRVRSGITAR